MSSDWEIHPSGIAFRTRRSGRTGETQYKVDGRTEWLSKVQFDALISGQHPREVPRTSVPYALFPPQGSDQPTQANVDRVLDPSAGDNGSHYEHGPRGAGDPGGPGHHGQTRTARVYPEARERSIHPATSASRTPANPISGPRGGTYRPQLTTLGQSMVQLTIGDYNGLGEFVSRYPRVVAQSEINSLLAESANAQRAGKEALAQTCVHHAVVLQKCVKYRGQELRFLFEDLAKGRETTKDLIEDVKKAHTAIIAQCAVPQPQTQDRGVEGMTTTAPVRDRAENPRPRIIQGYHQNQALPRPGVERVSSLPNQSQLRQVRDRDGRLVYVDDRGCEVRPAGGRHESQQGRYEPQQGRYEPQQGRYEPQQGRYESQRGRHDSESGPPIERLAKMGLDDSSGRDTSAQSKATGPGSKNPRPEEATDTRMGSQKGGGRKQQMYTIEGTEGDTESLDGDYKKRPNSKDFFKLGKVSGANPQFELSEALPDATEVFALLWHQSATGEKPKFELSKEISVTRGRFEQEIYSSIRRMVVVKEGHGHCWCLMINTYNEQGVLKSGLSPDDRKKHSVIYMAGAPPTDLRDERLMNKQAIAVNPTSPDQKLHKMSRLDFRRVHTVEHNVKVKDIGQVSKSSMPYLMSYWQSVVNEA